MTGTPIQLPSFDAPPVAVSRAPRRYFLTVDNWWFVLGTAFTISIGSITFYERDSLWIGLGLFCAIVVFLHTLRVSPTVPWIPGLISIVAFTQWVIAPWANYHVPADASVFEMTLQPPEYFVYAVPVTIMFAAGMYLPMWRLGTTAKVQRAAVEPRDFRVTCDIMIVIGVISFFFITRVGLNIRFLVTLLTYLAFIGAYGLMMVSAKGWVWKLSAVMAIRVAMSTSEGLFHDLLLWVVYTGALIIFTKRVKVRTIILVAIVGAFFIGVLDEAKFAYRNEIRENPDMTVPERFEALGQLIVTQAQLPVETFTGDALSHFVTRLNQGWIIARTMYWVPVQEPYANGETIINAFRSALIPRVLDPGKYEAGGVEYFERFTGFHLYNTSMNLGIAGEMYANFGLFGGILAAFLFGAGIGYVYRIFFVLAQSSIFWWAWAPYVLLYSMQAENGIGEGVNHVAKAFVVMLGVVYTIPAWRTLRLRQGRKVAA
jgi:hypothetical protein